MVDRGRTRAWRPWLRQSLDDLDGLRMATSELRTTRSSPPARRGIFTLFGRDSLWAARLLLPLGTDLAAGHAARAGPAQGTEVDPATAEEPGKILHELRRGRVRAAASMSLPPVYYGTVDATPLWVCLLADAWRAGLPDAEVRRAAAARSRRPWAGCATYGDADGDGFLEYVDASGHGLANQGWKDSGDAIQFADGRLAEAPIALCEVQGYAYEAAIGGAALLDALRRGRAAERWRDWAAALAERFRAAFWVRRRRRPLPGDRAGRRRAPGRHAHEQHRPPARHRHARPPRRSGWSPHGWPARRLDSGLRPAHDVRPTRRLLRRSATTAASVWPHDTAIAIARARPARA